MCSSDLGHTHEHFPNAFASQSRILSLPIFPEMSEAQITAVNDAIRSFAG